MLKLALWCRQHQKDTLEEKIYEEAIKHINKYNTGHSESIVTESYRNSQKFLQRVDAAAVYVNASTRFTDGGEFGFGGEIGISTQKLRRLMTRSWNDCILTVN